MTELAVQTEGLGSVTAAQLNTFIQSADTFAQLRGLVGKDSMQVFCKGGLAISDGLQGNFYWNATSTAADNGFSVIKPTGGATAGRWIRIPATPTYEIAFELMGGTPPAQNEVIGMHVFAAAVQFGVGWGQLATPSAAFGQCLTNPTAPVTATCFKVSGGVQTTVGTFVIATNGAFTFATAANAVINFAAGDLMYWETLGTADISLANLAWTIVGVPQ